MKTSLHTTAFFCAAIIIISQLSATAQASPGMASIIVKDRFGHPVGGYRNSHALVIAVDDYKEHWPDRPRALRDARRIKDILETLGFAVTLANNPQTLELRKELVDFINLHGQKQDNRLLIYFSGHCHNLVPLHGADEMEYLVPAGVPHPKKNLVDFRESSLSLFHLDIYARNIRANHTLFLLDGCRKGSALTFKKTDASEEITPAVLNPVRQFILFDGSAEDDIGPKENGPKLVNALKGKGDSNSDGHITASELAKFLRDDYPQNAAGKRKLVYGALEGIAPQPGNFIFPLSIASYNQDQKIFAAGKTSHTGPSHDKAEKVSTLETHLRKVPGPLSLKTPTDQAQKWPGVKIPETLPLEPSSKILPVEELAEVEHKQLVFWPPEEMERAQSPSIQEETFARLEDLKTETIPLKKTRLARPPKVGSSKTKPSKSRWVRNDDGTAIDTWSGLMWMIRDFRNVEDRPPKNWWEAVTWAEKINGKNFAGYNDWRVPTIDEMKFIYTSDQTRWVFSRKRKVGYPHVFENGGGYWYWSAEEQSAEKARAFGFYTGVVLTGKAKSSHNLGSVRLVRSASDIWLKVFPQ